MEDTGQEHRAERKWNPPSHAAPPVNLALPTISPLPYNQGWQSHERGATYKGARGTPVEDSSFSEHLKN